MNTQTKEQYTPPRCEELDARLEGVIAESAASGEFSIPWTVPGNVW